ncbi:MAG: SDR family oxidoreductase [Gemmatimonadales bacterium]
MEFAQGRGGEAGSVHVVLGATGGIGSAVARHLAEAGSRLMVAARDGEKVDRLARELDAESQVLDATRFDEVERCVSAAREAYGRVDGLVNCVGSVLLKPAHLTSEEEFNQTLTLNLGSAFAAVRAGAQAMRKEGGSIVLVSSAAAGVGLVNHEVIAAAKAGINGLVLSAAASYARLKIRVNAVAPGLVRSPQTEMITEVEAAARASVAMHALGRLGEPEDIASAIAFLLDPATSWVTGQILAVDGGLSSVRTRVKV